MKIVSCQTRFPDPRTCVKILDNLLGAPALVGLAHVGWRFDRWDEFQNDVTDTKDADNRSSNVLQDMAVENETPDKDIENTTANEGEQEGRIAVDIVRDVGQELQPSNDETKQNHIDTGDDVAHAYREELGNATKNHDGTDSDVGKAEDVGEIHFEGLGCRGVGVSGVDLGGTRGMRRYQSVRVVALLEEDVCCLDRAR